MIPINIGAILLSGLDIGLAFLIWTRNYKNKINILFSLSVLCVAVWTFGEAMFREAPDLLSARFWAHLENFFGSLVVVFFFLFSVYFPYQNFRFNNFYKLLVALSVAIHFIIIFTPGLYINEIVLDKPFNNFILHPIGRTYYTIYFIIYLSLAFYLLISKFIKSQGILKKNLLTVLIATGILAFFGTLFGIIPS